MDVRMPEMNGREATRKIRTLPGPNQTTPVIAVTADSDPRDVQACLDAGMDWFIAKPIDPAKLVQTVIEALQGGAQGENAEGAEGAKEVA
jgi:CheY-like chemotaxis protein